MVSPLKPTKYYCVATTSLGGYGATKAYLLNFTFLKLLRCLRTAGADPNTKQGLRKIFFH